MSYRSIGAIIFDLDGTLVDSWRAHVHSLRLSAEELLGHTISPARVAAAQRPTDLETLAALTDESLAQQALDRYHELLAEEVARRPVAAIEGAVDLLEALEQHGIRFGVCTGRSRVGAQLLLTSTLLSVPVLVTRDDVAAPKPAPDGLWLALDKIGSNRTSALFVGDTAADLEQGKRAGVWTIGVAGPHVGTRRGAASADGRLADVLRLIGSVMVG